MLFKKQRQLQIELYIDVDWVESMIDRRSTSNYCTFLGGNLVAWPNKKQNMMARGSVELKFRSITNKIYEVMWIKRLLKDLKI